jgi:hypothetical protein
MQESEGPRRRIVMADEPKTDTPETVKPLDVDDLRVGASAEISGLGDDAVVTLHPDPKAEPPKEVPVPIEQVVMSHEQRLQLIFKGYADLHERLRKVELRLGVKQGRRGELIT